MPAQPLAVNVEDKEALKLLLDNFDKLEHPVAPGRTLPPHPYLRGDLFGPGSDGRSEIRAHFCEGIVMLFEKHQPRGRDEAVELLMANIANMPHPLAWIKSPYFDDRFAKNPQQVRETRRIYTEAIVSLLEKNDKLKKRPGRPRKDAANV
jgi:hypothetical protein